MTKAEIDQKVIEAVWTVLEDVRVETFRALGLHPPLNSYHEAYAVLLEEVEEYWDEVRANNHAKARHEAVQVAAMAVRLLAELGT